jgi:hypothetical protein
MEQYVQKGNSPSTGFSPEVYAIMTADQREAIRAGGQGIIFDMKILWQPWGFRFENIQTKFICGMALPTISLLSGWFLILPSIFQIANPLSIQMKAMLTHSPNT